MFVLLVKNVDLRNINIIKKLGRTVNYTHGENFGILIGSRLNN